MSDIYHGRLVTDGEGNLLADEGENKGMPVAYHDGSYIFIKHGEPSHNEKHATNEPLEIRSTVDESMTDDPSLVNADSENNPHHFEPLADDPHAEGIKNDPDAVAAKITGHTDAWSSNE